MKKKKVKKLVLKKEEKNKRGNVLNKGLTKNEAMNIINGYGIKITKQTLYDWCKKYDIGRKIVGRYQIDQQKLIELLEKRKGQQRCQKEKRTLLEK